MKKRILHISKYYYPFAGGTEQIARDCVTALQDIAEEKVIAFSENNKTYKEVIDGIEVVKCGCDIKISSQSLSLNYKKCLYEIIDKFHPNIIIFHYPNPFVARLLLNKIKKKDIKLIIYWHLDITKQRILKNFFYFQNKELINKASKIIATSPNYVEGSPWLRKVKNKCVVIPNCINEKRMTSNEEVIKMSEDIRKQNLGKTICVAVGRHTKYKGFSYLIKASKLLNDDFRFYIAGQGELTDDLKKEASKDNKIKFTGRVNDDRLKALILAADIFCFPSISKNEAFGLALAEAMYYEKPAITFTIPGSGVNYVCPNGICGIEVENKNIKNYAEALKVLSNNRELREKMGKNGRQRVLDNFLYNQFSMNVKEMIKSEMNGE